LGTFPPQLGTFPIEPEEATTLKLRVGIIGCGNVGARLHLPAWLSRPDLAQVVGLADPTESSLDAARIAAHLEDEQVHLDPSELIARADVDVVDICTPQHLRRDILLEAIAAGKHILCEKPVAAIPADAAAAVAAAEEHGVTFGMVHNYLFLPEIRTALEIIRSGEIGTVRAAIVNFLGVVDSPGSAAYQAGWRKDPALSGGGVLMDMLHGVYVAEALLGEPIQRASAYIDRLDPLATVEDLALCRFETSTNAGLVNIGWGAGPGGMQISGTGGRIEIRYRNGATTPWTPLDKVLVTTSAGTRVALEGDPADGALGLTQAIFESFEHLVADFATAIIENRAPIATGRDGQRILEATLGAYASGATSELVDIPLDPAGALFGDGVLSLQHARSL
jgi:predicted dehydrogenase